MHCYSLLLGARQARAGQRRFSREDDRRLREITARHCPDGFTILTAQGGWYDPTRRRFIEEESRQVLVTASNHRRLQPWCRELAATFHQDAFLLVELGVARTIAARSAQGSASPVATGPKGTGPTRRRRNA